MPDDMYGERTAAISGDSRGIGLAIELAAPRQGATVVLRARMRVRSQRHAYAWLTKRDRVSSAAKLRGA